MNLDQPPEEREYFEIQWLGPVYGPEGAIEFFGADIAYSIDEFSSFVNSFFSGALYKNVYENFEDNQLVAESFYDSITVPIEVFDINEIVDVMRVRKSPIEFNSIQRAVDVSVQSFSEGMMALEAGMFEYEVEAIYDYISTLNGCPGKAFPTIVASGPNINILHYQANDRQMQNGDLVMIDFGAEYGYYAADITRTLPVNGIFSKKQADIYTIVLEAHKAAINAAAPGVNFDDLYLLARDIVLDGLLEKNVISGDKSEIISSYRYRLYIPAGLGHCVGLDVHDPFPRDESGNRILEENMIFAFEPHVYLYENDPTVNPEYWNISARIEDVVMITSTGSKILSKDLPIEITDIEAIMN
jgi:Xaa-Pro aminopeptidase